MLTRHWAVCLWGCVSPGLRAFFRDKRIIFLQKTKWWKIQQDIFIMLHNIFSGRTILFVVVNHPPQLWSSPQVSTLSDHRMIKYWFGQPTHRRVSSPSNILGGKKTVQRVISCHWWDFRGWDNHSNVTLCQRKSMFEVQLMYRTLFHCDRLYHTLHAHAHTHTHTVMIISEESYIYTVYPSYKAHGLVIARIYNTVLFVWLVLHTIEV